MYCGFSFSSPVWMREMARSRSGLDKEQWMLMSLWGSDTVPRIQTALSSLLQMMLPWEIKGTEDKEDLVCCLRAWWFDEGSVHRVQYRSKEGVLCQMVKLRTPYDGLFSWKPSVASRTTLLKASSPSLPSQKATLFEVIVCTLVLEF